MRVASVILNGMATCGVINETGFVDAGTRLGPAFRDLRTILLNEALGELLPISDNPADTSLDQVEFTSLIPAGNKVICVGLNYADHVAESGRAVASYPTIFHRFPDAQVGHGQNMILPGVSSKFDYEGELALIIGKAGRHIRPEKAHEHIAGYSCFNDGSIRDWQKHTTQFTPGKNFKASGALGPWLVTADEIADPSMLTLETRVNGVVMQRDVTSKLIFDIPALVAYISTYTELAPGDVIATGTPSGVGSARDPQSFLKEGDVVEVEISSIGILRNNIVAEV